MKKLLRGFLWVLVTCAGLLALVYFTLLDVWVVPVDDPLLAASLAPALHAGDVVLVWRRGGVAYRTLVQCKDPQAPGRFVAGRVYGTPGTRVRITDGDVYVDDKKEETRVQCGAVEMVEPKTGTMTALVCQLEGSLTEAERPILHAVQANELETHAGVEPEKMYIVSDNRAMHLDSRDLGQLPQASCRPIVFRLMSAQGFSDEGARLTIVH